MNGIRVTTAQLETAAAEALLAKHHVGSMAIGFHDRVTITLVNYVYANRWIYGRMEDGPDLAALRHHQWVAFELSEVSGIYDWRAVTVHGSVQLLSDGPSPRETEEFHHALALLRAAVPAVLTPRDPMPQRVQLFRVHVDELVGRQSRSVGHAGARAELPPA
jgi:uncharacterized protein